jgi:rubredoxin
MLLVDLEERESYPAAMRCPKCGTEQPEGAIQCGKCHLVFAKAKGPTGAQGPAGDKATQPPVKILRGAGPDKKQLSVRFSGARPKYPPCCACCLEPADAGVYFKFHEGKRLIAAVPACKRCRLASGACSTRGSGRLRRGSRWSLPR